MITITNSSSICITDCLFQFAGSLVVDLNEDGVMAEPVMDDRRFVFQVVAPTNKKYHFVSCVLILLLLLSLLLFCCFYYYCDY